MKGIVIVSLCLLLLLAGTALGYVYVEAGAAGLAAGAETVGSLGWAREWERARARLGELEAEWEDTRDGWAMIIDHDDMRDIEIGFVDLKAAIEKENAYEAAKEGRELAFYIRHVAESERPGMGNVL